MVVLTAAAPPQKKVVKELLHRRQSPSEYVEQITNFFSQHRWAKGKELLDEALELYPDDAPLQYQAGRYWWNAKSYDKCRYHLVKAVGINYHYVDAKSMLVNVEEITGNYSSAICYVNELLEVNPYWKGLWLRKVDLYKKMGNFEEANTLLKRLSIIYPNDASIDGDFFDVLETTYQQARVSGDLTAAEDALREIVRITPNDADYQLAYANILIRKGKMNDALDNLMSAVNANPGNVPLIKKATDILMETGRSTGALALVRGQMAQNKSPELRRLYDALLNETAYMENESDPYQLYVRVYNQDHSMESLQYLLTQSVKRGYFDDALSYIKEMRKRRGESPRWDMMEYDVYTRMGRTESAAKVMNEALVKFPDDYDINLSCSRVRLSEAGDAMSEERYSTAIPLLEWLYNHTVDPDLKAIAVRRLAVCYREANLPDKAVAMLKERLKTDPEYQVTMDYASLLVKQGKPEAAILALQASYNDATDSLAVQMLGSAIKETVYPYVKERLEKGALTGLQPLTDLILAVDPTDYWGLRYSLRTAEDPLPYAVRGVEAYPDDLTFPIKAANVLAERGQYDLAINVLRAYLADFPADDDLQRAYAGISDTFANKLFKEKNFDRAEAVLDSALAVRPLDPGVRYTRGLVYEKNKQWDSAYVYQRNYQPSVLEEDEYKAKMNGLRARTLRNSADAGVDLFRFSGANTLMAIATVGYAHSWARNEFQARVNYTGRDADWSDDLQMYNSLGGRGLQLMGGFTHHFGTGFSMGLSAGYGTKYFPKVVADVTSTIHFPLDWDMDIAMQLRYLPDESVMAALNLGATHTWANMYAGARFTSGFLDGKIFFNGSARYRFYPFEAGRTFVEVQAGAGTAPEISLLNYYYSSNVFNHLNSFAAASFSWAVSYNLSLQLSGTWSTLYNQTTSVTFRNMFLAHVSASFIF